MRKGLEQSWEELEEKGLHMSEALLWRRVDLFSVARVEQEVVDLGTT